MGLLKKIAKDPKLNYDQKKRLFEVAFDIALSEKGVGLKIFRAF